MRRPTIRSLAGGAAGIAAGICSGVALTSGSAGNLVSPPGPTLLDAAHLPPVLTLPGERITLRYAILCSPTNDGRPCEGSGEVYVRAGQDGPFRRLGLTRGDDSAAGRYFVDLPAEIASSRDGFSYYAVVRDDSNGMEITLPSGGGAAPQVSLPLQKVVDVELGPHSFGRTRPHDARVVHAPWGSALGAAGLAGSRELGFVGPSSFDVGRDGEVTMLDQINGRLQHWARGRVSATPVDVSGGLADLAIEPDGTADVLEPPNRLMPSPTLRSFEPGGKLKWTQRLSDRTWAKLAVGPEGPVVLQEPSEQWLPSVANGAVLDRPSQAKDGRSGRPVGQGVEVFVERVGVAELRLAEVARGAVVQGWRLRSSTPLGEVQLAEPVGKRLVVVVKTYTEEQAEYIVLVLDRAGVVRRSSLEASQWAEAAPLARFRLSEGSLYQLGSTPAAAFVDRYDLEVSP
jgi:hypothetical protein